MGDGIFKIEIPRERDPGRARLGGAVTAHYKYERCGAIRTVLVHLLVPLGALLFVVGGWPGLLPRRVAAFGLALWALGFVGVVAAGILEYKWYRRRTACLEGGERPREQPR